jgi:hypothetical protein
MADENREKPAESEIEAIERVLAENDVDPQRAIEVLVRTIMVRHIDCELRKMGRRPAFTPGNERTNSLVALLDALFQANFKANPQGPQAPRERDPEEASGELTHVRQTLIQLLTTCQFLAEDREGFSEDDGSDDDRPPMRLVTD